MANYGGPDPYAFRELLNATRAKGEAVTRTIDKLGEVGSMVASAYGTKRREQGIDMTAEATAAGLDWEGKAEGKKVSLFDVKRMGIPERQALLSLAKSRREANGYRDAEDYEYMHAQATGVAAPDAKSGMVIAPLGVFDAIKSRGVPTFEYTLLEPPGQSGELPAVQGSTKTPALPGASKLPKNSGSARNQSGDDAVVKFGRGFVDRLLNMGGL